MFPFGFGAKKDRGMGRSVLAAREMKRGPKNPTHSPLFYLRHFSRGLLTLVPSSLTLNHTETLATQAKPVAGLSQGGKFSSASWHLTTEIKIKLVLFIIAVAPLDKVISNEQGKTIIRCLSCLFAIITNNRKR